MGRSSRAGALPLPARDRRLRGGRSTAQRADPLDRHGEHSIEQDGLRSLERLNLRRALNERPRRVQEARRQWTLLGLTARLAGLEGQLVRGRYPMGVGDLIEALQAAAERADQPAHLPLLQAAGFDEKARAELAAAVAALSESHQAAAEARAREARLGDQTQVVRGALLAEVGRLRLAAALVLTPEQRGAANRVLGMASAR